VIEPATPNDLRSRLGRALGVRPGEGPATFVAFALFFCLLGGYFAVRPVRETVGTVLGNERVASLWTVVWIVSLALVPIYGWLVSRVSRRLLLPWIYGGAALALGGIGASLMVQGVEAASGPFFYVMISVLNLFIVSVFWSFLLEIFDADQRLRLFGVVAAGGTSGALAGPLATDLLVGHIGEGGVLMLGATLFVVAVGCQRVLLATRTGAVEPATPRAAAIGGNPFEGLTLVLRSPWLLGIAGFVVLSSTINTLLYFQQQSAVAAAFADTADRTRYFARIDWVVQGLAVLAQVFVTGRLARRFGLAVLLGAVPLAMVGGFTALAVSGGLTTLAVVIVLRRAGEFAFVRIGRELLFGAVDNAVRYKAKNVIDVPVYRGADALAAQVQALLKSLGAGAEALAWLGAGVAAAWGVLGIALGRRQDRRR
jgi:AAA family ATP:ADP antiporter